MPHYTALDYISKFFIDTALTIQKSPSQFWVQSTRMLRNTPHPLFLEFRAHGCWGTPPTPFFSKFINHSKPWRQQSTHFSHVVFDSFMVMACWRLPNNSHDKQLLSYNHQLVGLHNEGCCEAQTELVHSAAPRLNPGQFMWDLLWAKRHWVRFFPNTLVFPCQYHFTKHSPVSNISPMLHLNATFIGRTRWRKLGTFKANLFLIREH